MPHLAQLTWPLYSLIKKGAAWDWDETVEKAFTTTQQAVQQAHALQVIEPGKFFELDVCVTVEGYGWAYGNVRNKLGPQWVFWSQL